MRTDTGQTVRLADYRRTPYAAPTVEMSVDLDPTATRVSTTTTFRLRPGLAAGTPLALAGDGLALERLLLNGEVVGDNEATVTPDQIVLHNPPAEPFTLTVDTIVDPDHNTELMGLYRSNGIYCTQCEAEGFRRITYAYDRPDVLSRYRVRIDGGEPGAVLLSNGNLVEEGVRDGKSFAVWDDPFPKPSYLFALVAGRLGAVRGTHVTPSGKRVALGIYVEPGKEARAEYALDSLIRSMVWDEQRFGREYDLDVFNIVAVSDFNMGAMENKGLNVFNDRYVLADPRLATDGDYAGVETVIAHEYFHNWTGNRITCRDWFQLCLKEGLTVYRDQEFTSDERSRGVKRIEDVRRLRQAQFREDAGPLRHPVRPGQYDEISNLYTATVYEKGAEVIRVLQTLVGDDGFSAGMDTYFSRYDGHAATIEDFLGCFDLPDQSAFMRWYEEPGTPTVAVDERFEDGAYTLTLRQKPAAGASPKPVPVRLALVAGGKVLGLEGAEVTGAPLSGDVLVLGEEPATLTRSGFATPPRASILRGFSAPVHLEQADDEARDLELLGGDNDSFNVWDAAQRLGLSALKSAYAGAPASIDALAQALSQAVAKPELEAAFRATLLVLPTRATLVETIGSDVDAERIEASSRTTAVALGAAMRPVLLELMDHRAPAADDVSARAAGLRALRNAAMTLAAMGGETAPAVAQAANAGNMTDRLAAISALTASNAAEADAALAAFHDAFESEPLVLDKYFILQALRADGNAIDRVSELMRHPKFSLSNPNRVRSLVGAFTQNVAAFHAPSGSGYRLVAGVVRELDGRNPQVAARLLTAFGDHRRYDAPRRAASSAVLGEVAAAAKSSDVADIARRLLGTTANS